MILQIIDPIAYSCYSTNKLTNYEFDQLQIRDLADKLAVRSIDLDIYNLAARLAARILNAALVSNLCIMQHVKKYWRFSRLFGNFSFINQEIKTRHCESCGLKTLNSQLK